MKLQRFAVAALLLALLPSCGSGSSQTPTTPQPPSGPTAPASFTVQVTINNATASASSSHREAPFSTLELDHTDIYVFLPSPNAGARVGPVTEVLTLENGTVFRQEYTPDPNVFLPGETRQIARTFIYDIAPDCGPPCEPRDLSLEVIFSDDLGNGGIRIIDPVPVPDEFIDNVGKHPCAPGSTTLCLNDGRFRVETKWRNDTQLPFQPANTLNTSPDGSAGEFWFFSATNFDLVVQVLDSCAFDNRFWVFFGSQTNVEYLITVTDTNTGVGREYFNPLGNVTDAITDTDAFATCPGPLPFPRPIP